jgi:hypothetical protein
LENSVLYYKNNNNLAGQNMLTQKALTKNLIATLCTTSNTLFVHNNKTVKKAAFVYTQNAQKVVRNLNAQQQAAFNNLPATYMQNAKKFLINKLAQSTILKS